MFYGHKDKFASIEMAIDIVQNGAVATGNVYPQPQCTGVLWDAYLIKAVGHSDTRESLFYMSAAIHKSIKKKFNYECKATWNRVSHEKYGSRSPILAPLTISLWKHIFVLSRS